MKYQYEYDDAGNCTKMKYFDGSTTATTNYNYNDANQLYHSSRGSSDWYYTYDDNGNLTDEDTEGSYLRDFTWNDDNRLTYVDNIADDNEVEYTYDALGRRIMRNDVDTNTWTKYYYDGLTVIAEKKKGGEEGSGIWDRIMTVAPGVICNIFCISTKSGENWEDAYYHYDAIGNVVYISNIDGTPLSYFEQEAYGNVKVGSQSGYHLTTKEYDSHPELYYFWQWWYDPLLGRFVSKSILPNFEEHPYLYCGNNPLNDRDMEGEKDCRARAKSINSIMANARIKGIPSNYSECWALANEMTAFLHHCINTSWMGMYPVWVQQYADVCKGFRIEPPPCPKKKRGRAYEFSWGDLNPAENPYWVIPIVPILVIIPGPQPIPSPLPIPIFI